MVNLDEKKRKDAQKRLLERAGRGISAANHESKDKLAIKKMLAESSESSH